MKKTMKFWIKLYIENIDDPKMARLPDALWRRLVELFLLAGRQGSDGGLPPLDEMAWSLRLSKEQLLADLQRLAEMGLLQPGRQDSWLVTNFQERQASESHARVKRYRERYKTGQGNAEAAAGSSPSDSTSTSTSDSTSVSDSDSTSVSDSDSDSTSASDSDSDSTSASDSGSISASGPAPEPSARRRQTGAGAAPDAPLPDSPAEAMLHPDVRVYSAVTGGRIPGLSQYRQVIEAVRFVRAREELSDGALAAWLKPYWLAWTSRKRLDGRPYDPANLTWLTEWALNGTIPPPGGPREPEARHRSVPSPEQTRRMLDEREAEIKKAVPPPEHIREKMRGLKEKLEKKASP
jgi:hypothetical protein